MKKILFPSLLAACLGLCANPLQAKPPEGGYSDSLKESSWSGLQNTKKESAQQMTERLGVDLGDLLKKAEQQYTGFNFDYHISRFIPEAADRTLTNVRNAEKTAKEAFNNDVKNLRDAVVALGSGANQLVTTIKSTKEKVDKKVSKQLADISADVDALDNKLNYRGIAGPDFKEAIERAQRLAKLGREKLTKYETSLTQNIAALRTETEKLRKQPAPRVNAITKVKEEFATLWSQDIRGMGTALANVQELKDTWSGRWNAYTKQDFSTLPKEGALAEIINKLNILDAELTQLRVDIANLGD